LSQNDNPSEPAHNTRAEIAKAKGAEKKAEDGKLARDKQLGVLSQNDKTPEPAHNTRAEIAEASFWGLLSRAGTGGRTKSLMRDLKYQSKPLPSTAPSTSTRRSTPPEFADKAEARVWMRTNQMGRRNLTPAWRIELELGNKEDLKARGAATQGARTDLLSQNDKKSEPAHNTQKEIAKAAGVSTGQVGMAEQALRVAAASARPHPRGDPLRRAGTAYNLLT
jgi:hypothetical protein